MLGGACVAVAGERGQGADQSWVLYSSPDYVFLGRVNDGAGQKHGGATSRTAASRGASFGWDPQRKKKCWDPLLRHAELFSIAAIRKKKSLLLQCFYLTPHAHGKMRSMHGGKGFADLACTAEGCIRVGV